MSFLDQLNAALAGDAPAAAVPDDGDHQARLTRAVLRDTRNGECLVTEWADEHANITWDSWNRFDTAGMSYTVELLQGLGIKAPFTDTNALELALVDATGKTYNVRTSSKQGSSGDRWFTNTYVDGRAQGVQEALADLPVDTSDLPARPADSAALTPAELADDTIPF